MLTGEIIGSIRLFMKEQSDDSLYSDQAIYNELVTSRARITAEKYSAETEVPFMNWQTITVRLEKQKYVDCRCIRAGCEVLRSEVDIPSVVVTYMKRPLITVRTFNGETLPYVRPERQRHNVYSETMFDQPAYYIENNKLIIWNSLSLKAVQIEGVFSNPVDLASINICNEDGESFDSPCYDPLTMPFPADADIVDAMKERVISRFFPTKQIVDDTRNDSEV